VEIVLFGADLEDPAFGALPHDFPWTLTGVLTQKQVARLFNEVDIFVDFSSHQAMGLTALEAMACGVAVIVPEYGGATTFARHGENSLVVDTTSRAACWQALHRLIEDDALRSRLQRAAIHDVAQLFPERSAFDILQTLFG
jgi:glycosyltransferase involved in cell wall biosynthesis